MNINVEDCPGVYRDSADNRFGTNPGYTAGRCRISGFVYVWKAGRGRRLYQAGCPAHPMCQLRQTCLRNIKHPNIRAQEPTFLKGGAS